MRNYIFCHSAAIVLLFAFAINSAVVAQDANKRVPVSGPAGYPESIYIKTDRDIYITGEMIWFKIHKSSSLTGKPMDLSRIVYVELLDRFGNSVNQIKYSVTGTSGPGGFRLSDTLSTGSYLLRAYTFWMLNQPEETFFHKPLTIVNPYKNIEELGSNSGSDMKDSLNFTTGEKEYPVKGPKAASGVNYLKIWAEPDKKEYNPRDPVNLKINATDVTGKPVKTDISVSVVKNFLVDSTCVIFIDTAAIDNSSEYMFDRREKLPEMEGELIRGIIRNKTTNEPLNNTGISLSFVGRNARCQFTRTDENGEFLFVVKNVYGLNEIVIQPVVQGDQEFYVEIYQPFENLFSRLHPGVLKPDSSVIEGINNAVISKQVNSTYDQFIKKSGMRPDTSELRSFYGKPFRTVWLADFIDLTNIREVVKELLPEVEAVKKDKTVSLRVISSNPFEQFENQPLVLVDGVPVFDMEQLLNVSSKEIERIDIFNTRYFISDFIFEGIVSFYTKKGDLSSVGSDYSGYRQVLEGSADPGYFNSPDYSSDSLRNSRIADFRNTLYWDPLVRTTEENGSSVHFFTSDEKGDYLIVIEGITDDGRKSTCKVPLIVR